MSKIEEMAAEDSELRKGPWTVEEDGLLAGYIASHGEGRWNLLARCSGLKRSGKSCRLRWLNYLKPDVKRGDLTPGEQLCILELHSKWGNRWSRIAQYLPGRTDNEIKNYWRTRVQKQARQLNIDANSEGFRDAVRRVWMPRLIQQMQSSSSATTPTNSPLAFLNQGPPQASPQDSMRSDYRTRNNSNCSEKSSSMEDCCPSTSSGSMMRRISQYPEMTDFLESSPSSDFSCNTLDDPRFLRDSYVDTSYNLEAENLVSASTQELDYGASRLSTKEMSWADDMTENLWNMDELRLIMDQQGRGSPF